MINQIREQSRRGDGRSGGPASVGFAGIGVMGEPMALSLVRTGVPLIIWNRSPGRTDAVKAAGARVASSVIELFRASHTVILMMVDHAAIDQVLRRGTPEFDELVRGRTVINMATTPPAYSAGLETDLRSAGARYVEAPVSGQRPIAEAAKLVAMAAGDPGDVTAVTPLLKHMCISVIPCGTVPNGLLMKLAVNLVSGAMMTAAAEGANYARSLGLDVTLFASVLNTSSLASDFLRMKLAKLAAHDFAVHGAIGVGRKDFDMMRDTAARSGAAIPMLDLSASLWDEAINLGFGDRDVSVVLRAYEARSVPPPTGAFRKVRVADALALQEQPQNNDCTQRL